MSTSVETFRTDLIARPSRLAFWNDVAVDTFGDISVDAPSPDSSARLRRVRLGGLTFAKVSSTPARVQGARPRTARAPGCFLLFNEQGDSRMSQGPREVHLEAGDLTVLRADERYRIEFSGFNTTLVLYVPRGTDDFDLGRHVARRHACHEVPALIGLMRQNGGHRGTDGTVRTRPVGLGTSEALLADAREGTT